MKYTEILRIIDDTNPPSNPKPLRDILPPNDILKAEKIKTKHTDLKIQYGSSYENDRHDLLATWCQEQDILEREQKLKELGI